MSGLQVAVFTSSRADLGPLGPVIEQLDADQRIDLTVIAAGTHLDEERGGRIADIPLSSGSRLSPIPTRVESATPDVLGDVFGEIAAGVSRILRCHSTDVVLLLGDRWELLAVAGAALIHDVAIAHLHGGETTEGAVDERIRHAVTKLADLHLCANEDSASRIRQLGEESWRVVVTGAPGLDRIGRVAALSDDEVSELLGMPLQRPLGVVVYHPTTVDRADISRRADNVYNAAAACLGSVIALYPGLDPGADEVIDALHRCEESNPNVATAKNLGERYLPLLSSAEVLVGNSSSGIIESASLGLPTVDVGERQHGRLRPANVLHVDEDEDHIRGAIAQALDPGFREKCKSMVNPYGDGQAAQKIVEALATAPIDRLRRKAPVRVDDTTPALDALIVDTDATVLEAMEAIDRGRCGMAMLVDHERRLVGVIVDGDIRRAVLNGATVYEPALPHANLLPVTAPITSDPETLLALMDREQVTQLPLVDSRNRVVGLRTLRGFAAAIASDLDT